jgi:hypothetical protein
MTAIVHKDGRLSTVMDGPDKLDRLPPKASKGVDRCPQLWTIPAEDELRRFDRSIR